MPPNNSLNHLVDFTGGLLPGILLLVVGYKGSKYTALKYFHEVENN